MSVVVFSEGFNDLLFLSELHKNSTLTGDEYDVFNNEMVDLPQNRRLHHHKIGQKYKYLYKSEGGRPKLIPMFAEMIVEIYDWGLNSHLVIDLDGDPIQDIIDEINSEFQPEWGNRVRVEEDNSSREILTHMYITSLSVKIHGSVESEVNLIAFHEDLEAATNIHKEDSEHIKREKIRDYIRNYTNDVDKLGERLYS